MNYKIAVCLSGQPRTWKYCYSNILKYFGTVIPPQNYTNVEIEYFIHTWNYNQYKVTGTTERPDNLHEIADYFNTKHISIDNQSEGGLFLPWQGLFESFNKSIAMKRTYEIENNFSFDVVFKSRLDVIFDLRRDFYLPEIRPLVCYSTHEIDIIEAENYQRNFNDIAFYCDSSTMDLLSDAFDWFYCVNNIRDVYNPNQRLGPGAILYRYMVEHGIHPVAGPFLNHTIFRETAIQYDGIEQFDEIYKINQSIY